MFTMEKSRNVLFLAKMSYICQKCSHYLSTNIEVATKYVCSLSLQVYQASTGHYICHNKYYGRNLKTEGVQDTLHQFLHSGNKLRVELIDPILEKLRKLYSTLSKHNTFRFYSSSLLIMYDGVMEEEEEDVEDESLDGDHPDPEDENMDSEDLDEHSECEDISEASGPSCSTASQWDEAAAPPLPRDKYCKNSLVHGVDVRMIDFAHATHQGFRGDRTVHTGPDQGYLFGLENLMRMIEQVRARAS